MTDTSTEAVEGLIWLHSRQFGNLTGREQKDTAAVLRALLAERDALQAKLDVAVLALTSIDELSKRGVGCGSIPSAALSQITKDDE